MIYRHEKIMRASEFITEAISLTYLRPVLIGLIKAQIDETLKNITDYSHRIIPDELKTEAKKNVSLTKVKDIVEKNFKTNLSDRLSRAIPIVIKEKTGVRSHLFFSELNTDGKASNNVIHLNLKYLDRITSSVISTIFQITLDNLASEDRLYDDFFKNLQRESREVFGNERCISSIEDMTGTLIHEYVHVIQHVKQLDKGRKETEYRSYLEKDKDKFYSAINRITSGDFKDNDYRLYQGSPQEIAAFAHNSAIEFIRAYEEYGMDYDNVNDLIKEYMDKKFSDPSNRREYRIFKRFNKLMYQEVMRYIERLKDQ